MVVHEFGVDVLQVLHGAVVVDAGAFVVATIFVVGLVVVFIVVFGLVVTAEMHNKIRNYCYVRYSAKLSCLVYWTEWCRR